MQSGYRGECRRLLVCMVPKRRKIVLMSLNGSCCCRCGVAVSARNENNRTNPLDTCLQKHATGRDVCIENTAGRKKTLYRKRCISVGHRCNVPRVPCDVPRVPWAVPMGRVDRPVRPMGHSNRAMGVPWTSHGACGSSHGHMRSVGVSI